MKQTITTMTSLDAINLILRFERIVAAAIIVLGIATIANADSRNCELFVPGDVVPGTPGITATDAEAILLEAVELIEPAGTLRVNQRPCSNEEDSDSDSDSEDRRECVVLSYSDVDFDGDVDTTDALLALRIAVELDPERGVEVVVCGRGN